MHTDMRGPTTSRASTTGRSHVQRNWRWSPASFFQVREKATCFFRRGGERRGDALVRSRAVDNGDQRASSQASFKNIDSEDARRERPRHKLSNTVKDDSPADDSEDQRELYRLGEHLLRTTLEACEWPRVLRQLSRFARTAMAKERLLMGREDVVRAGKTAGEANDLLAQTTVIGALYEEGDAMVRAEVEGLERDLEALGDVSVWLRMVGSLPPLPSPAGEGEEGKSRAQKPRTVGTKTKTEMAVLDVRETDACVTCVEDACACVRTSQQVLMERDLDAQVFSGVYTESREAMLEAAEALVRECRRAVKPGLLYLDSGATPRLSEIRDRTREVEMELRTRLEDACATLFEEEIVPEKQVVFRRDRYCIPVKRGMQGASGTLKGAITLGESKTGQTVYVEPKFCVPMNNELMRLRSEEAKEETRVLRALTSKIRRGAEDIMGVYDQVVEVDTCFARAKHAAWIGGIRPEFAISPAGEDGDRGDAFDPIALTGVVHPVLLEQALESSDGSEVSEGGRPSGVTPVDISVPKGCRVLTISGPNTGGKTASMKTIALCLHMAKCGLFLPTGGSCGAKLAFFDKVLADIGDNQSLEGSLSTFSSHVTRLRDICAIVEHSKSEGSSTLVLLDEVGSGTNPTEGAAIAVATLRHLSESATLTVATTHFSELKALALAGAEGEYEGWRNASVEFDLETLRPTYRLVLGELGASNALHIARAIGLDESILRDAEREVEGMAAASAMAQNSSFEDEGAPEGEGGGASAVFQSLSKQLSKAKELEERSEAQLAGLETEAAALGATTEANGLAFGEPWTAQMRSALEAEEADFVSACERCVAEAVESYESGRWDHNRAEAVIKSVEAAARRRQTEISVAAQATRTEASADGDEDSDGSSLWFPKRGDRVKMRRLGGTRATVVSVNKNSRTVTLKKGNVSFTSSAEDLER